MRNIGNGDWLDEHGRLYITTLSDYDAFAPIGQESRPMVKATPYTFEDVPTTGLWGVIYRNNPLHFASHETTKAMRDRIAAILSHEYVVEIIAKEQTVGPFRRGIQRDIRISRGGDLIAEVNAGQEALRFAKEPSNYPALVLATVAQAEQR